MTTESESTALTVAREELAPAGYTDAQIDLLRQTIVKDTTPEQFALFASYVRRTGLDPFARQIYAIVRKTKDGPKMTIQTGIDGFRALAQDTGQYGGRVKPTFGPACDCGLSNKFPHPVSASVVVKKVMNSIVVETEAEAYYHEYVELYNNEPRNLWAKMPRTMIAKCAEAQALRAAFPKQLSGIYSPEEMAQADSDVHVEAAPVEPKPQAAIPDESAPPESDEHKQLVERIKAYGKADDANAKFILSNINNSSYSRLGQFTVGELQQVLTSLEDMAAMPAKPDEPVEAEVTQSESPANEESF